MRTFRAQKQFENGARCIAACAQPHHQEPMEPMRTFRPQKQIESGAQAWPGPRGNVQKQFESSKGIQKSLKKTTAIGTTKFCFHQRQGPTPTPFWPQRGGSGAAARRQRGGSAHKAPKYFDTFREAGLKNVGEGVYS